jgi:hypothetical protein
MHWIERLTLKRVTRLYTAGHIDAKSVAENAKLSFERTTTRGHYCTVMAAFPIADHMTIAVN